MNYSRQVAFNTVVQLGGKALTLVFGLLILKLITQTLGPQLTGQYNTAITFAQLFTTISDLGLYAYLVRDASKHEKAASHLLNDVFTLRIFTGLVFYLVSLLIIQLLPYEPSFYLIIALALISGLLNLLNTTIVAIFQARLRMELSVISDVINRLFTLGGLFIVLQNFSSLTTVMVVLIIAIAINFILNITFLRTILHLSIGLQRVDWKKILGQSAPIWVTAMLGLVYFKIDGVMLSFLPLPPGKDNFVEVGYYSTVYKYLEILLTFPAIFFGSLFPVLNKFAETDRKKFNLSLQKAFDVLSMIVFPILIGTFLLAKPLIILISSAEFLPGAPALQILIVAFFFSGLGNLFSYAVMSLNRQKELVYPYAMATLFNVIINYFAIRYYSFIGAAVTTVCTELLISLLAYNLVRRAVQFSPTFITAGKSLVAALIMGVFIFITHFPLLVTIFFGAGLYFCVFYLIGGIDPDLIRILRPQKEISP